MDRGVKQTRTLAWCLMLSDEDVKRAKLCPGEVTMIGVRLCIAMIVAPVTVTPAFGQMAVNETHQYAETQLGLVDSVVSSLQVGSTGCDDPQIGLTEEGTQNLDARLADLDAMAFSPRSGAGTRHMALRELKLSAPFVVNSWRRFAGGLLKAGCLDGANQVYRRMLTSYAASTFEVVREEAKVGIDDVRAARMMVAQTP